LAPASVSTIGVNTRGCAELPELAAAVAEGAIDVHARAVPLAQISQAWTEATSRRIVFVS
jgi:hypothetical protein